MRKASFVIGTLLCVPLQANSVEWFESKTPLTQAHQHLLNDDLPSMFSAVVEVWQQDENPSLIPHLNDLLLQSLEIDCGKSLVNTSLPQWIDAVTIRRTDIQSPGRDAYRAVLEVTSEKELANVSLKRWVDKTISTDHALTVTPLNNDSGTAVYTQRYNVNSRVPQGLYRIDVTASDQESWSSWLVLGDPKAKYNIRWASKDQWQVEKLALLNKYCPLPKLKVELYDYIDGQYTRVWQDNYDSDYPMSVERTDTEAGRYVLAITMTHQRWQGHVNVEQTQIISKTYDVSVEE